MERTQSMLLMLVIVGLFIHSSQALRCYECSTITSSDCGDPFKSSTNTCTAQHFCTKIYLDLNDQHTVVRGCDAGGYSLKIGCQSETYEGNSATLCACDTDKCNGAVMTASVGHVITVFALLISVVIGYLL